MFVDEATVLVTAGRGGSGMVAFRREKYVERGGPAGGDGGRGGDVVFIASHDTDTLSDFRHQRHLKAENGRPGGPNNMTGRNGADLRVVVPVGTLVFDDETGDQLIDLTEPGQEFVVASGGDGGFGNTHFKSSNRRAPRKATDGFPGEAKKLRLELKLIADVALVGFPSVGKSTIIAAISNARPKIADYPFTTLVPNLGVVSVGDYKQFVVADVPGLIEGAHEGLGLGVQFLKHIERTKIIVHVVEVTAPFDGPGDGRDPLTDFEAISGELASYAPDLAERPTIVVLNKIDLPWAREKEAELREYFEGRGLPFMVISAATGEGIEPFKTTLAAEVIERS